MSEVTSDAPEQEDPTAPQCTPGIGHRCSLSTWRWQANWLGEPRAAQHWPKCARAADTGKHPRFHMDERAEIRTTEKRRGAVRDDLEMPERFGVYRTVGDTPGLGGSPRVAERQDRITLVLAQREVAHGNG